MTKSHKKILHDATPVWNGFNYQGKVGLYVVLKNILDYCGGSNFENYIKEHSIEFEWAEDFSIKNGDVYISQHQVKHYGHDDFSNYIEAIETLIYRKECRIPDKDIIKYIKENPKKPKDDEITVVLNKIKSENIITNANKLDLNWESKLDTIEINFAESVKLCLLEFKQFYENSKSCNVYLHTSEKILEPNAKIVKNLFNNNPNLSHLDIHYYSETNSTQSTYSLALSDDELKNELIRLTKEILNKLQPNQSYSENDICVFVTSMKSLIDNHISERHQHIKINTNHKNFSINKTVLEFNEFTNILKKEFRDQNDEYWDLVCRENFEDAFEDYIKKLREENCPVDKVLRLEEYRNKLILKYESKYSQLFKDLSPNEEHKKLNRIYYENIAKIDSIQNVFLEFIYFLDLNEFDSITQFMCSKNVERFQASCINLCPQGVANTYERNLDIARHGIKTNRENNGELLHNVNYLVVKTDQNNIESTGLVTITEINEVNRRYKLTDKYISPKEMYFIGINKAAEKING